MGDHLNRLNKIMDEQMSSTPVFTANDKNQILLNIKEQNKKPVLMRRRPLVPALLTVALIAGLLLFTFSLFEKSVEPLQQAGKEKVVKDKTVKENKDEQDTTVLDSKKDETNEDEAEVIEDTPIDPIIYFENPTGEVVINNENKTVEIRGNVTNAAKETSPQFAVKVNILNPELKGTFNQLEFPFKDAQYANAQSGAVFEFWEEVPLLKNLTKADLENAVQLTFTINDKVIKTHIIKNITVIEEPPEQPPEKETMKIEEIKKSLARGMTQEEVKAIFGSKYTEVTGSMNDENYWRFDIGADPDYNFNSGDDSDALDNKGLIDGTVDTILFVEWDENLKVNSFSFYNILEYGFNYSYRVFENGNIKEDKDTTGGILD
ncbi:hypothetical protein P4V41_10565 [Fictibacillus nanhaiensis]|uniref:hypothetical protein n=1 Tax=Fictibacillus nanhaiensis TaxID=742169 RepID=UPI002E242165|nr:hypothetical protein [Fictibacillus nanhaiensis]